MTTTIYHHEAAHCIVGAVVGLRIRDVWADPGRRGETSFVYGDRDGDARRRLLATLAGQEGERMFGAGFGYRDIAATDEDTVVEESRIVARLERRSEFKIRIDARREAVRLVTLHGDAIGCLAAALEGNAGHLAGEDLDAAIDAALRGRVWRLTLADVGDVPDPPAAPTPRPSSRPRTGRRPTAAELVALAIAQRAPTVTHFPGGFRRTWPTPAVGETR